MIIIRNDKMINYEMLIKKGSLDIYRLTKDIKVDSFVTKQINLVQQVLTLECQLIHTLIYSQRTLYSWDKVITIIEPFSFTLLL